MGEKQFSKPIYSDRSKNFHLEELSIYLMLLCSVQNQMCFLWKSQVFNKCQFYINPESGGPKSSLLY